MKRYLKKDGEFLERAWNWVKAAWAERPLSSLLVTLGFVGLVLVLGKTIRLRDTGFEPKTLWDWMELLLVPLVLAIGGWWLNKSQQESERKQAEKNRQEERLVARERREQETLEAYFDRMTQLMLEGQLREKAGVEEGSEIKTIARARTLAVLKNLGPERKGKVIEFLYESQLIDISEHKEPVVSLHRADLAGVILVGASLKNVDLHMTDLEGASLLFTNLQGANMVKAILSRADLQRANLQGAIVPGAALHGANLEQTNLQQTKRYNQMLWIGLRKRGGVSS